MGGMRAVLWQWAGDGLPLPQAKSPLTVAQRAIHFEPESQSRGSGSLCYGVEWVVEIGGRIAGCAHPLEKSGSGFADASIHRLLYSEDTQYR